MRITDTRMTSDRCADVAELRNGRWLITGHPGRSFDRNQAITAMTLAEVLAAAPPLGDPVWFFVQNWRDELDH
ncbi:hypothetical protein [Nonomuraea sp. NPDC046570]|uniref:hypothetical protein n=1 Tax=Nonomuraea sp. NPDC046570 TaxID=3155255 RepID=UPI0033F46F67